MQGFFHQVVSLKHDFLKPCGAQDAVSNQTNGVIMYSKFEILPSSYPKHKLCHTTAPS